ncbi:hypothetical protein AMK59_1094, partial [Oryctes borbonicus]
LFYVTQRTASVSVLSRVRARARDTVEINSSPAEWTIAVEFEMGSNQGKKRDGDLYSGTVADFSGMDPIIYRESLQTEQYDSMSLNAPDFVSSMAQGDFVYFFFRETAVEYINCGKTVYSRVARVCKNDRGGPHRFRNRWTSFLKSRLNCSVSGDFPFYFNE